MTQAEVEHKEFNSSKGLKIKFLRDGTMDFVHAELLIYYRGKFTNPAVPPLTFFNLFNEDINKSGSSLVSALRKMGNDYTIDWTPDFFHFKINFLPDKISTFIGFLKLEGK